MGYSVPQVIFSIRAPQRNWFGGPFFLGGNRYIVARDATDWTKIAVVKGVEGATSITWTLKDSANARVFSQPITGIWACVEPGTSLIRIAVLASYKSNSVDVLWFLTFDTSSDTYSTGGGGRDSTSIIAAFPNRAQLISDNRGFVSMAPQLVGGVWKFVVCYTGDPNKIVQTWWERVYLAYELDPVGSPGIWTIDLSIDNAGAAHWYGAVATSIAGRVHCFFSDFTNGNLYQRTWRNNATFETFPAASDTVNPVLNPVNRFNKGVSFNDGTNDVVRIPYEENNGDVAWAEMVSSDAPGTFTPNKGESFLSVEGGQDFPQVQIDAIQTPADVAIIERQLYQNSGTKDTYYHEDDFAFDIQTNSSPFAIDLSVGEPKEVSSGEIVVPYTIEFGAAEYNEYTIWSPPEGSGLLGVTSCAGRLTRCRG